MKVIAAILRDPCFLYSHNTQRLTVNYLRLQSSLQLIEPFLLVHHPGPLRLQLLVRAADHLHLRPLPLGHQPEHLLLSHLEKRHHKILVKRDFFAIFFRALKRYQPLSWQSTSCAVHLIHNPLPFSLFLFLGLLFTT